MFHVSLCSFGVIKYEGLNGYEKKEEYSVKVNFKGEGGIRIAKKRLYTYYLNENILLCIMRTNVKINTVVHLQFFLIIEMFSLNNSLTLFNILVLCFSLK